MIKEVAYSDNKQKLSIIQALHIDKMNMFGNLIRDIPIKKLGHRSLYFFDKVFVPSRFDD